MGRIIAAGLGAGALGGILGGACGWFGIGAYFSLAHPVFGDCMAEGLYAMGAGAIGTAVGSLAGAVLGIAAAAGACRR